MKTIHWVILGVGALLVAAYFVYSKTKTPTAADRGLNPVKLPDGTTIGAGGRIFMSVGKENYITNPSVIVKPPVGGNTGNVIMG